MLCGVRTIGSTSNLHRRVSFQPGLRESDGLIRSIAIDVVTSAGKNVPLVRDRTSIENLLQRERLIRANDVVGVAVQHQERRSDRLGLLARRSGISILRRGPRCR